MMWTRAALFVSLLIHSGSADYCPDRCTCDLEEGDSMKVFCNSMPLYIPKAATHIYLNLQTNSTFEFEQHTFSRLDDLQEIVITGWIGAIKSKAFFDVGTDSGGGVIVFRNARIDSIEEWAFEKLSVDVVFERTRIQRIHSKALSGRLRDVEFSYSKIGTIEKDAFSGGKNEWRETDISFYMCDIGTVESMAFSHVHGINGIEFKLTNFAVIQSNAVYNVSYVGYFIMESCYIDRMGGRALDGIGYVAQFNVNFNYARCMGATMLQNTTSVSQYFTNMNMDGNIFPMTINPYSSWMSTIENTITCYHGALPSVNFSMDTDCCPGENCLNTCFELPYDLIKSAKSIQINLNDTGFPHTVNPGIFCALDSIERVIIRGRAEKVSSSLFQCDRQNKSKLEVIFEDCRLESIDLATFTAVESMTISNCFVKNFHLAEVGMQLDIRDSWIDFLVAQSGETLNNFSDAFTGNNVGCIARLLEEHADTFQKMKEANWFALWLNTLDEFICEDTRPGGVGEVPTMASELENAGMMDKLILAFSLAMVLFVGLLATAALMVCNSNRKTKAKEWKMIGLLNATGSPPPPPLRQTSAELQNLKNKELGKAEVDNEYHQYADLDKTAIKEEDEEEVIDAKPYEQPTTEVTVHDYAALKSENEKETEHDDGYQTEAASNSSRLSSTSTSSSKLSEPVADDGYMKEVAKPSTSNASEYIEMVEEENEQVFESDKGSTHSGDDGYMKEVVKPSTSNASEYIEMAEDEKESMSSSDKASSLYSEIESQHYQGSDALKKLVDKPYIDIIP